MQNFTEERTQLLSKIEQLTKELSVKDKTIFTVNQKVESMEYTQKKEQD